MKFRTPCQSIDESAIPEITIRHEELKKIALVFLRQRLVVVPYGYRRQFLKKSLLMSLFIANFAAKIKTKFILSNFKWNYFPTKGGF